MPNQSIIQRIEDSRRKTARFFTCNLHVHSPSSHDYGKQSDLTDCGTDYVQSEKELSHEAWLNKVVESGLEVLAITDHNVFTWGCEAAACAQHSTVVFPGCEITVKHNTESFLHDVAAIHLLAVFDPGTESNHIDYIFARNGCTTTESKRDGSYQLSADIVKVIQAIHDLGGLCIAAHVDSNRGIRWATKYLSFDIILLRKQLEYLMNKEQLSEDEEISKKNVEEQLKDAVNATQNNYLNFLIREQIDAVQIAKPKNEEHYGIIHTIQVGGIAPIACILATDSHRLCDISLPNHLTHIKMTTPSIDGLKKAFRDPATRIRFYTNLPPTPYPRLRGIEIQGDASFFTRNFGRTTQIIGFSDNLTCIIGGRGSGKSCIVEALRYVLGREQEYTDVRHTKEKYTNYLQHLFEGCYLNLVYDTKDGNSLIIKRQYDPSTAPIVEEKDGTPRRIIVDSSPEFKVDIYGQSQIEDLALDKSAQRHLIDAVIPDSKEFNDNIKEVKNKFKGNTQECVRQAREIKRLNETLIDLPDIKAQLTNLRDPKILPFTEQQDTVDRVDSLRSEFLNTTEDLSTKLAELLSLLQSKKDKCTDILSFPLINSVDILKDTLKPSIENIERSFSSLMSSIQLVNQEIVNIQSHLTQLDSELKMTKSQITIAMKKTVQSDEAENIGIIVQKRMEIQSKYERLQPDEVRRDTALDELNRLLKMRQTELLAEHVQVSETLFKRRYAVLEDIIKSLKKLPVPPMNIELELKEQLDRSLFRKRLGESGNDECFLKGNDLPRHKFERKWAKYISSNYSSLDFENILVYQDRNRLLNIFKDDGIPLFDNSDIDKLFTSRAPFSNIIEEPYNIDPDKLNKLLNLTDETLSEDLPEIKFEGRLIEDLSPGQRCSALIPIILLSGDWPLIIDQPEDNLDNMHIFECLVEIIRNLKHQRQIICATHNANVVVSGDAEQVIVCNNIDSRSGQILLQASIDDEDHKDDAGNTVIGTISYVKSIMEGGEDAFKTRARKYGFKIL